MSMEIPGPAPVTLANEYFEDPPECLGCEICGTCFELEPEGLSALPLAPERPARDWSH